MKKTILILFIVWCQSAFGYRLLTSMPTSEDIEFIKENFHEAKLSQLQELVGMKEWFYIKYDQGYVNANINSSSKSDRDVHNRIGRVGVFEIHASFSGESDNVDEIFHHLWTPMKDDKSYLELLSRYDEAFFMAIKLDGYEKIHCYYGKVFDSTLTPLLSVFLERSFYCDAPFEVLNVSFAQYLKDTVKVKNKKIVDLFNGNPKLYKHKKNGDYVFFYGIDKPVVMLPSKRPGVFALGKIQYSLNEKNEVVAREYKYNSPCLSHIVSYPDRAIKIEYDESRFSLIDLKTKISDDYTRIELSEFNEELEYSRECR